MQVQGLQNRNANIQRVAQRGTKRRNPEGHVDYTSTKRVPGTMGYMLLAKAQLTYDFNIFHVRSITAELFRNNDLYAPTFIKLYQSTTQNVPLPGVTRLKAPRRRQQEPTKDHNPDFQAEYEWVQTVWKTEYDATRANRKRRKSEILPPVVRAPGPQVPDVVHEAEVSMKIECGCCFDSECSFGTMIQCSDAHLFCRDCVSAQAGTAVGNRRKDILCMDMSGCRQPFPASELKKCLDTRTFALWQKIVQAEDIAAAQLEGLEHCPFCDYAMIFEVDFAAAPLLKCLKPDCMATSCRRCRKKEHTGRQCEDVEDTKLKAEHAVEDAMTNALIRKCPGCQMPFIKENGCNKMVCTNLRCRMISCYHCRQPITLSNPYDHFDRTGNTGLKCVLWDSAGGNSDARHAAEVKAAEQLARRQLQGA